jgi:hypothetical protein
MSTSGSWRSSSAAPSAVLRGDADDITAQLGGGFLDMLGCASV